MSKQYNLLNEASAYEMFVTEVREERNKALEQVDELDIPTLVKRPIKAWVKGKYTNIIMIAKANFNRGAKEAATY